MWAFLCIAVAMIGGLDTDICCSDCKCSLKPEADTDRWLLMVLELKLWSHAMLTTDSASDAKIASMKFYTQNADRSSQPSTTKGCSSLLALDAENSNARK